MEKTPVYDWNPSFNYERLLIPILKTAVSILVHSLWESSVESFSVSFSPAKGVNRNLTFFEGSFHGTHFEGSHQTSMSPCRW